MSKEEQEGNSTRRL